VKEGTNPTDTSSTPVSLAVVGGGEGEEMGGFPLDLKEEKLSSKTDEIAIMTISRRASAILSLFPFRLS
jgi:hypothetical protein